MVQRYSIDDESQVVFEDEYGDYVDYSDYERLEAENTELRRVINELRRDEIR